MKFYNSMGPNPKLVRMFAAEKGYSFDAVEEVDMIQGANRQEPYLEQESGRAAAVRRALRRPLHRRDDRDLRADRGEAAQARADRHHARGSRRDAHVGAPDRVEDHPAAGRRLPLRRGAAAVQESHPHDPRGRRGPQGDRARRARLARRTARGPRHDRAGPLHARRHHALRVPRFRRRRSARWSTRRSRTCRTGSPRRRGARARRRER